MQAREYLDQAFGTRLLLRSSRDSMTRLAATLTDTGSFTVSDLTLPGDLTLNVTGSDTVVIGTIIEGTVQFDRGKDTDRYQPGDVALGSWPGQASYTSQNHHLRCRGLILPVSLLHAVAGRAPSAPLRFLSPRPASPADRDQWTNISGYIDT
jgi:hypothetical protein